MAHVQRVPVLNDFSWQPPITSIINDPSVDTPTKGARYIVGDSPAGVFATAAIGDVATKMLTADEAASWEFNTPLAGWRVWDKTTNEFLTYNSGAWSSGATFSGITLDNDGSGVVIDSTLDNVDWLLDDNEAEALSFITVSNIEMLNFNTTDGSETVQIGLSGDSVDLAVTGELNVDGGVVDISAVDSVLKVNDGSATGFKIVDDGDNDLLTINTDVDIITAHNDVVVVGDLTVQGTTTTVESTNLTVSDKNILLNDGGTTVGSIGSGIDIQGDSTTVIGYLRTGSLGSWDLNAGDGNVLTLDINATETITVDGSLNIEDDSNINQDLTTDSSVAEFVKLTLSGSSGLDFTNNAANITVVDNQVAALTIGNLLILDTVDDQVEITKLNVTGNTYLDGTLNVDLATTLGAALGVTGNTTLSGATLAFDNVAGVNVTLIDELADSFNLGELLVVDTVDDQIEIAKLDVGGTLSVTAGATFLNTVQVTTSGITDGTETVTVVQAKQAFDQRAKYDSDLDCIVFPEGLDTV